MHGFALNVCGDLSPFERIVPCGISNVTMTSIKRELGKAPPLVEVAERAEKLALHRIANLRVTPETQSVLA
jgi:lipoyl(octanoyl) transferase